MKQYTVAIVGATGAVGTQMLQCLEEQEFPVGELKLLASPRSAGKKVETPWGEVVIEAAAPECFDGVDIVLGAAEDDVAKALYPEAVRRGAVVVDNSHAFRLDEGVPLVVPEINAGDIASHHGIIANPNCATIIGLVPTWPLHQLAGVKRMIVSTYQAASGAGMPGMLVLLEVARRYRDEKIPLSVIIADYFHWTEQGDYKFDPQYWPDVKAMTDELHSMGTKLVVSVWPTINENSENYRHMKDRNMLIRTTRGSDRIFEFYGWHSLITNDIIDGFKT